MSHWRRKLVLWMVMVIQLSLFLSVFSTEIHARKLLKDNHINTNDVRLHISDRQVIIDNGLVEVTIENPSGYLIGVKYKEMENVLERRNHNSNRGYWDIVWDDDAYDKLETKHVEVITQTNDIVELSFTKTWNSKNHGKTLPLNIQKRYIVRRGISGVYMYGIFERQEDFPEAHMYQIRIAFKLKEDKFRFMAISDTIQRVMPQSEDRVKGHSKPLDFKEAVLLTNPSNPKLKGEGYQFWTQTDEIGRFNIKNVRPGVYNLYAWAHGFIGSYKLDLDITILPGNKIELNTLIYDPPRNGPTLWEIGIPDRTAAEFFIPEPYPQYVNSITNDGADKFRQYGLWDRYSDIYRDSDLVYTVGTSNYSKDWFFAHVPRKIGDDRCRPTTWQIKYNLQDVNNRGTYTLQMAIAAASFAEVEVQFNDPNSDRPHFTTKRIGYDNAVPRHGIHGLYRLYSIEVPGYRFRKGSNTIYLTQTRSDNSFEAVMYDYIRLEGPNSLNN
ncbi:hypothetical protein ES319_D03G036300v1 [Gossypium barbadense]|uniref:Rhamnogalacturonan lyase domain-containing protein n=1 Tax=Gossypium barbadense TaxID=3634 RepID=A0A5J5S358_GOSBA|nr:hypothetical protein ES319_D03G036300v1 [Gossypium barbadense]